MLGAGGLHASPRTRRAPHARRRWPGHTPRDIKLAGPGEEVLLAANQDSHCIVSFRRDTGTGALSRLAVVETPSPCCLLPLAWPPA